MSFVPFQALPLWAMILSLAAHLAAGMIFGTLYFGSLLWTVRLFAGGRSPVTAAALMIARIVVLGAMLALTSFEGALPLLITALGILFARAAVTRLVRRKLA